MATKAELDQLALVKDPKVKMLDLTKDFLKADGTIRAELFLPDKIHLSLAGYEAYAHHLEAPITQATLANQGQPLPAK